MNWHRASSYEVAGVGMCKVAMSSSFVLSLSRRLCPASLNMRLDHTIRNGKLGIRLGLDFLKSYARHELDEGELSGMPVDVEHGLGCVSLRAGTVGLCSWELD